MGGGNEVEGNKKVIELSVIYRHRIDRERDKRSSVRTRKQDGGGAGSGSLQSASVLVARAICDV